MSSADTRGAAAPARVPQARWRHATVIAQKSLAEGFGLTVAEGTWKGRPVIGSAAGGIIDQIAEGTGILLPDPADLAAFGAAARLLLGGQDQAALTGQAAQAYVRENFLGDVHLLRDGRLPGTLIGGGWHRGLRPAASAPRLAVTRDLSAWEMTPGRVVAALR